MQVDLSNLVAPGQTIGVAISGGKDSIALLYYMLSQAEKYSFKVVAVNVEHGIRGQASKNDTAFVTSVCEKLGVKLYKYSVDAPKKAKENKLSLEESARALRYECFFDAIDSGKCQKIATAHHLSDNLESVLLNLFRGTGLKGVAGIESNFDGKIIRPFLSVSKSDIDNFITQHDLPFVVDQTNFDQYYTRNYIRLSVIPKIKEIFPEVEKSVSRFTNIAKAENDYLEQQAQYSMKVFCDRVEICLPLHDALISRCAVYSFKHLGVKKDWEKAHVDLIVALKDADNGVKIDLKNKICAVKEYNRLVVFKEQEIPLEEKPFILGTTEFGKYTLGIHSVKKPENLKDGFFADFDKIPKTAVIRTKKEGDKFTKFGGGTKSLGDYLTDVKIPARLRHILPILADENEVLAIFGLAISDKIKVNQTTKKIIELTKEENYEQEFKSHLN